EKAMADPANDEDRAVAMADQAVIDSQSSGHIKDLAAVERQPLLKILTTFYSYQNMVLNQAYEVAKRPESAPRRVIDAALLLFIPSAMTFFLRRALNAGNDDKDTLWALLKQELSDLFGLMIGTREITGAIEGRDYEGPAGMRYVSTFAKAVNQIKQGEP